MKTAMMTMVLMMSFMGAAHAEESTTEKVGTSANDAKRAVKKGMNRTKEAVCMEGDAKCALKKGKHRMGEGVDAAGDKAAEVKDKID
ncbi:MAG: hypothetical protein H7326_00340 [Bdellovibrionaceae bacterium]|nr:hypothetical protein [Pseudobdellovibrionaceae bacterium]